MVSKKRIIVSTLIVILLTMAAVVYNKFKPVAIVGEIKIFRKDIVYRDKVIRLSNPDEKRSLGLFQLVKSATNHQILKKYGHVISENDLKNEEQRIDKNTRDPDSLKKIKDIFGNDHESYLRDFVQPNLVDNKIYYGLFLNDEKIHSESLNLATSFINKVISNPSQFKKIAEADGVMVKGLTLSLKNGMIWEQDKIQNSPNLSGSNTESTGAGQDGGMKIVDQTQKSEIAKKIEAEFMANQSTVEEAKKWHELLIGNMKEGTVTSAPANREESWLVIHYVKRKSKDEFILEVAFFKKQDFSQWYEKEKAQVNIEIFDKNLQVPN